MSETEPRNSTNYGLYLMQDDKYLSQADWTFPLTCKRAREWGVGGRQSKFENFKRMSETDVAAIKIQTLTKPRTLNKERLTLYQENIKRKSVGTVDFIKNQETKRGHRHPKETEWDSILVDTTFFFLVNRYNVHVCTWKIHMSVSWLG